MTGTELARPADERPSVKQLIVQMTPEIEKALPAHLDATRVARIAVTLIGTNPALAACTPESFLGALMTASQLGLEPGPLGEAYLVPYGKQVTFIPGYRGLIKLAYQSGMVLDIAAHVVRANDDFEFAHGLQPYLHHKPAWGTPRGEAVGVYAVANLATGRQPFIVLDHGQVEAIRRRSKASKNGPWVTDWDAMARKTAIRQLARWLPMSTDLRDFGMAVALDGSRREVKPGAGLELDRVAAVADPLELEAAPARLDPEQVRAAAHAAKQDSPSVLQTDPEHEADWHAAGHPKEGRERQVWAPDCPVCDPNDVRAKECYYGHAMDWVEDCPSCQTEKRWKETSQ